ncbi:M10 family metallopeptidase C-terminal domain-containing protein [Paracoccus rhizosphaerae]|uniref:M10 family metallopeptidase C-terminal domain-containing protein n=1 Tax=Paracoccus rhizosphaerae TaxID=1133347 RepID=A0ABV6CH32_9RHOB
MNGAAGADVLQGGAGNDRLFGDCGADRLIGNLGSSTLTEGEGADTFVFSFLSNSRVPFGQRDVVTDFRRGQGDNLDLFRASTRT